MENTLLQLKLSLESVVQKTAIIAQMVFGISSSRNPRAILYCGPDDPLKYYLKIHKYSSDRPWKYSSKILDYLAYCPLKISFEKSSIISPMILGK